MSRSGRSVGERERLEKKDEGLEFVGRRIDRDRSERHDLSARSGREPRKPDDGEENFGSRRSKKTELTPAPRGQGRNELDVGASQRSFAPVGRHDDPEWFAGDNEQTNEDDSAGKTVDDFERWKRSMKKNDGSGDAGLPPIKDEDGASIAQAIRHDEEPPKDVRPPPGFAGVKPVPQDLGGESSIMKSVLEASSQSETKLDSSKSSSLPPGFTPSLGQSFSMTNTASPAKSGSSKFSKFFGQTSQSQATPGSRPVTQPKDTSIGSKDVFSALDEPRQGANKDDAEGFERILAMLSSQSAPRQNEAKLPSQSKSHQQPIQPDYGESALSAISAEQQRRSMSQNNAYGNSQDRFQGKQQHPQQMSFPPSNTQQTFQLGGLEFPSIHNNGGSLGGLDRQRNQGPYSPDRQPMPAMRDHGNGPASILSHHTQNQDFFSSLLSQSKFPSDLHDIGTQDHFGSSSHQRPAQSPPHARHSPPSQRHEFDPRDVQSRMAFGTEPQHLRFMRQQQQQYPQQPQQHHQGRSHQQTQTQSLAPARPRDELEFLNQLMAEQRVQPAGRSHGPIYGSQGGGGGGGGGTLREPPQGGSSNRAPTTQGFITGVGSRPGPGWNGQFEVDPRLPSVPQYRS